MDALRRVWGGGKDRDKDKEKEKERAKKAGFYDHITHVAIPKFHISRNGHVDYIIECTKGGTVWQLSRRYTQFKRLHSDLTSLCPMSTPYHCEYGVVPVLCGTSWTEVTNQSIDLIEKRKWYLEVYLEQLLVKRNRFYQARTALYAFLHDGETLLTNRPGQQPLPGLGAGGSRPGANAANAASSSAASTTAPAAASPQQSRRDKESRAASPPPQPPSVAAASSASAAPQPPSASTKINVPLANSFVGSQTGSVDASDLHASVGPEGPSYGSFLKGADMLPQNGSISPAQSVGGGGGPEQVCRGCGRVEPVFDADGWDGEAYCCSCQATTAWDFREAEAEAEHEDAAQVVPVSADEAAAAAAAAVEKAEAAAAAAEGEGEDEDDSALGNTTTSKKSGSGGAGGNVAWSDSGECELCSAKFSFFLRRHHCRSCGGAYCGYCSAYTHRLAMDSGAAREVRVCKVCKERLANAAGGGDAGGDGGAAAPAVEAAFGGGGEGVAEGESSMVDVAAEFQQNSRELSAADFELVTTLGKGTFGKVMKVRHRQTGDHFAMKVLSKKVVHKRRMVAYIREEKDILAQVNHPFIVRLYAAFQTDHNLYLLLEFLPGGELYTHIYSQGRFGEVDASFYTAEMALAIGYLHSKDIVHRDIKPENIVLDRQGHAVLTDFGLAKQCFSKSTRRSFVGSSEYLSPETIKGDVQTKAVDWWSLGVLLYEMLVGAAPFNGTNNNDVYQQILHKDLSLEKVKSEAARSLLRKLLTREVKRRLRDVKEAKVHAFFAHIDWDLLEQKKLTPPFVPDLSMNDTRYFSKEFTHEWAKIDDADRTGRNTLELLSTKFDNFPVEGKATAVESDAGGGGGGATGAGEGGDGSGGNAPSPDDGGSPSSGNLYKHFSSLNTLGGVGEELGGADALGAPLDSPIHASDTIAGAWCLKSLELVSEDGRVSFPWGSQVVGQAVYTENGLFSLECTLTRGQRSKFRDADYTRVTREEMAEAYLTYVSSFGHYTCEPGKPYITHHAVGSLCPNWAEAEQRRYYRFADGSGEASRDYLILATGSINIDGYLARTIMKFQREPSAPATPDFVRKLQEQRAEQHGVKAVSPPSMPSKEAGGSKA